MIDFTSTLKHKKKRKPKAKTQETDKVHSEVQNDEDSINSYKSYTYLEMLKRLFDIVESKNKNQSRENDIEVDPPDVSFLGTKKTVWANFKQTAQKLKRNPDHILAFFSTEMGTHASIDTKGRMIIKGRLHQNKVERPLQRYIRDYVRCNMCHKYCTHLKKDPTSRLLFLECDGCQSNRSVNQIRNLYHATSRADRIQAKKAAA